MHIRSKFAAMIGLPIVGIIVLAGIGIWSLGRTAATTDHLVSDEFGPLLADTIMPMIDQEMLPFIEDDIMPLITDDISYVLDIEKRLTLVLEADRDAHQTLIAEKALLGSLATERPGLLDDHRSNLQQVNDRMAKAIAQLTDQEALAIYQAFASGYQNWRTQTTAVIAKLPTAAPADGDQEPTTADPSATSDNNAARLVSNGAAAKAFGDMRGHIDRLTERLYALIDARLQVIDAKRVRAENKRDALLKQRTVVQEGYQASTDTAAAAIAAVKAVQTQFLIIAIIATVIAILIGYLIGRGIIRPIIQIIGELGNGSQQVDAAAMQVKSASQSQAACSSEQAASLEEISASVEELTSMTGHNAAHAKDAAATAQQAQQNAHGGRKAVQRLTEAMSRINASAEDTARIVQTIDAIAFQTNLLALNAAVEAARAGDAGRGFAVVAEEVRSLAQRCADAARDTTSLIEQAREASGSGDVICGEVRDGLEQIVGAVDGMNELVQRVSDGSEQQALGLDQIARAMQQLDNITQSNAANAEETASASEDLGHQAAQLRHAIDGLTQTIEGSRSSNVAALPAPEQPRLLHHR